LRLALSGPHGSGKTTLLSDLKTSLQIQGITTLDEITRVIRTQGFNINEAGTMDTQILVMNAHMNNLLYKDNFIVDRCLLDGWAYTTYLAMYRDPCLLDIHKYCETLLSYYLSKYDAIFYIPAEFDLVEDGVRSADKEFRETIIDLFETKLAKLNASNIHRITGTRDERVSKVLGIIKELNSHEK
jgi:nicotinamide riboside kinase